MQIVIPPPPGVQFIPRHEWGLTDDEADRRGLGRQPGNLPEGYIHHAAGNAPDVTVAEWDDDPIAWIRNADAVARRQGHKAWLYTAGVHFADGVCTIIEGRGDRYPGATKNRNGFSKAVCFAGNHDSTHGPNTRRRPHQIELDAARWYITNLRAVGWLRPDVEGRGHSQNPSCPGCTACPGDWLLPHVPYIFTPYTPPTPTPPAEEDTMFGFTIEHVDHVLLDTRQTGPRLAAGQPRTQPTRELATAGDVALNVQALDVDGTGWLEVNGRSVAALQPGRVTVEVSLPGADDLKITSHGTGCHVRIAARRITRTGAIR